MNSNYCLPAPAPAVHVAERWLMIDDVRVGICQYCGCLFNEDSEDADKDAIDRLIDDLIRERMRASALKLTAAQLEDFRATIRKTVNKFIADSRRKRK
jgi:hypothetical protein